MVAARCILLVLFGVIAPATATDCAAMKTKELRAFLRARGLSCEGCAEKNDFVKMCEDNKNAPLVERTPSSSADAPKDGKDDKNIEDLLASMKGMPGMEGIKMFTADDLKNMNPEQMGSTFGGGGGGGGGKPQNRDYKTELVDFYTRYGLTDKLDGVDAALKKWKGREYKMMDALYRKYDDHIKEYWDKQDKANGAGNYGKEDL